MQKVAETDSNRQKISSRYHRMVSSLSTILYSDITKTDLWSANRASLYMITLFKESAHAKYMHETHSLRIVVANSVSKKVIAYVLNADNGRYRLLRGWLGSRVVSVLDSSAEGPGFRSQSRRCRVTVLGKLLTPVVPLFTKQQNWQQSS